MGLAWRDVPLRGHQAPRPGGRRHEPKAGTGPPGWWGVLGGGADLCGCPLGSPLPRVGAQRGRVAPTASSGLLPPLLQNLPPDPSPALLHPLLMPPPHRHPLGSPLRSCCGARPFPPPPFHRPLLSLLPAPMGAAGRGDSSHPRCCWGRGGPVAAGTHRSTHADRTGTGTCLGRGRHHVSSRGSGWARGTREGVGQRPGDSREPAGGWGHAAGSRMLGTPRGAGDTQGRRHHPATGGFLGEWGSGHRGAGDTAHAWKPGLTLARGGPWVSLGVPNHCGGVLPGELQQRGRRSGTQAAIVSPWHRLPRRDGDPIAAPRHGHIPTAGCGTAARGAKIPPPPFPPPPHLGASQGCSRAGGTPRRGAKPPLPGLVLASPRLQGATTALCDGTRHATRTRPTYPIGLGTACSQGKAGGWSACSTRKRTQRRLRQSLRYRSVCRGGEEDDGERGPGAAPPPPPPAVPQHLPPPLRGRGLGGGAPSWGRGWHLVLAGGCDRVARPPPALWPRLRPRLAHGLGTPLGTGRVDPSELENSAVPSEERLGGGTVPLLLLASPSSLRHP